ncbi:MAG: hypothetical protein AVDCRST_MAG88-2632 [uncultured Thermomicrobiales bacterium]|uniref:Uncharacterized protein n=1 Tax=uncultured Thermomicrobiales bacterium TaxID=1645740 RepID=A0A6J4VAG4_9BACT|nr:MAG: hypothetical protein AVDCRST_MAG88-2632 [uncultured Thermomicrobiales bacterium]
MVEREERQDVRTAQADEVVRRNIEESRKLLDAKQEQHVERSHAEPPRYADTSDADQDVLPRQVNVPIGGNTGSQIRDGRRRAGQP